MFPLDVSVTFTDDGMGMEPRRGIAINRAAAVMLEFGNNPFAGRLRRSIATHPGLHVSLQLIERHANALLVHFAYAIVAAHQSRP
jgi:hypothetical protein